MSRRPSSLTRNNLGFLLAKAMQRWNDTLQREFARSGFGHVRPAFGSVLIPLFEEDGLRLGDLSQRGGVSKQTMTTMVREVERAGLVRRAPDAQDARATRVFLTEEARRFAPVAERVLAALDRRATAIAGAGGSNLVRDWLRRFAKT